MLESYLSPLLLAVDRLLDKRLILTFMQQSTSRSSEAKEDTYRNLHVRCAIVSI